MSWFWVGGAAGLLLLAWALCRAAALGDAQNEACWQAMEREEEELIDGRWLCLTAKEGS